MLNTHRGLDIITLKVWIAADRELVQKPWKKESASGQVLQVFVRIDARFMTIGKGDFYGVVAYRLNLQRSDGVLDGGRIQQRLSRPLVHTQGAGTAASQHDNIEKTFRPVIPKYGQTTVILFINRLG
jgi:hypothetical protein